MKRILGFGVCLLMMAASYGTGHAQFEWAKERSVYDPKLPALAQNSDTVKNDVARILTAKNREVLLYDYATPEMNGWLVTGSTIRVLEDRMEFLMGSSQAVNFTLFYFDLLKYPITVEKGVRGGKDVYVIYFKGWLSLIHYDLAGAQRVADGLYFIQQQLKAQKGQDDRQLALFETKAAEYRALKVKPPVSEEQRRLIVQANALSQQKEYSRAITLYHKAIDLDPMAYPAAYFNMALLSAQLRQFYPAIVQMKKYLLLEPEARDARSAQDKIYEWEILMQK